MVNQRIWVHVLSIISRGCVWEIEVWVLPALLQRLKGWGVSAQTIRRTLHQIGLHGGRPRRKPLLKMMYKKASQQFAEDKQTKDMDDWNRVLWSDETKINLFCSDACVTRWGEQQSGMVVRVSWSGAAWVLPALGSYSSLREPRIQRFTVTNWSRA